MATVHFSKFYAEMVHFLCKIPASLLSPPLDIVDGTLALAYVLIDACFRDKDRGSVIMGANCCAGMKSGPNKSLPESQKANNVDETDMHANGPQGDAAVDKETPNAAGDQQPLPADHETPAPASHTADHMQTSSAAPEEVELKITEEPDRPESEPAPVTEEMPEQPATPPTDTDVEKDQNKLSSAEVLFVSEDGDVAPPASQTAMDQHAQTTHTTESSTEVLHTTTLDATQTTTDEAPTSVEKVETQPEVVEQSKPGAGDEFVTTPDSSQIQTPAAAATDEAGQAPAATMSGGTGDALKPAEDTEVVVEAPAAASEVSAAAIGVDLLESAAASEQLPDDTAHGSPQDTAVSSTDTAPPAASENPVDAEQHAELPSPPAATEANNEPVMDFVASAGVEQRSEGGSVHVETSVECASEQPVQPQHPATDDAEAVAAAEQMPPSPSPLSAGVSDVEGGPLHVETSAEGTGEQPVQPEQPVTDDAEAAAAAEEMLPAPPEPTSKNVDVSASAGAEAVHVETSVEAAGEQPVEPQHPATDDAEAAATAEQTPPSPPPSAGITDTETPADSAGETPAAPVMPTAHEEAPPAAVEETSAPTTTDVEATYIPTTAEIESISTSSDAAWQQVVDETPAKPDDAAATSSAAELAADIQPEELPPPLSPDSEEAAAPAAHVEEIHQQAASNDWQAEPPSEQPEQEQHAVNESVEEPRTATSEAAEHVDEQLPVTDQP